VALPSIPSPAGWEGGCEFESPGTYTFVCGTLYGGRSPLQVQVGRRLRSGVGDGRVTFAAALNPVARRALRRNGRLSISLRLTVTPPEGKAYTATRTVVLRAR